jgi:hypothetical protein
MDTSTADLVLYATGALLLCVIFYQLWISDRGDMELLIENGWLYIDKRKQCQAGAGNGCTNLESGRWPVTIERHPHHECDMVYARGVGWLGGYIECDVVLGEVRGRHSVLANILSQERLRVVVLDALLDGKTVSLEVRNG